jgi:hypothetical protein
MAFGGANMKAPGFLLSISLAAAAASCSVSTRGVALREYPPRPPDHPIEVTRGEIRGREYASIGLVSVAVDDFFGDVDDLMPALKAKARQMGGDAVIHLEVRLHGGAVDSDADEFVIDDDPRVSGTVVRFLD